MYHALDMGISVTDFWEMTPRAICVLMDEMVRTSKAGAARQTSRPATARERQVVKLDYIPRP